MAIFILFLFLFFKCVFSFLPGTTYFLCSNKESRQRKSSPVAAVTSEFYCFFALSGFDSHPCSTKPGSASLPRSIFNFQKPSKLTHQHMGESLLVSRTIEFSTNLTQCWLSEKLSMSWLGEQIGCNASKAQRGEAWTPSLSDKPRKANHSALLSTVNFLSDLPATECFFLWSLSFWTGKKKVTRFSEAKKIKKE